MKIEEKSYKIECELGCLETTVHIIKDKNQTIFTDFRVNVLEPAMREINEFSDLKIRYETEKDGKLIAIVTFLMAEKTVDEQFEAKKKGLTALDGKVHWWD